jgi:DNA-binding transcriptional MerR regulator
MTPLLSINDVATILNVTPKTLYLWHSTGKGPRVARIGRQLRYSPEDVRAFVDAAYSPA